MAHTGRPDWLYIMLCIMSLRDSNGLEICGIVKVVHTTCIQRCQVYMYNVWNHVEIYNMHLFWISRTDLQWTDFTRYIFAFVLEARERERGRESPLVYQIIPKSTITFHNLLCPCSRPWQHFRGHAIKFCVHGVGDSPQSPNKQTITVRGQTAGRDGLCTTITKRANP